MTGKLAKKIVFELPLWTHLAARICFVGAAVVLVVPLSSGQGTSINPPKGFGQVPQGTGACSVEKSCADLAPMMIKSAEGPSPLEENLRTLTDSIGGRVTGSPREGAKRPKMIGWISWNVSSTRSLADGANWFSLAGGALRSGRAAGPWPSG